MPTLDLVGSAEAAKLLEIGPTNFSHLRKKMNDAGDDNFPEPIAKLQCGPIWRLSDMNKFKKHYDSRRRRVRSSNGDATAASAPVKAVAKTTKATAKAPAKSRSKAAALKPKPRLKVKTSA